MVGYLSSHVHKVYVLIMIIQLSEEQSLQVLPSPQIRMQQQTDSIPQATPAEKEPLLLLCRWTVRCKLNIGGWSIDLLMA
jgi:hypothetical protein